MASDLDARLQSAVVERDQLAADAQRIAGRKQAAEATLESVKKEIRGKNLDPETLDETIEQLETAYASSVTQLEEDVQAARAALSPYLETTNS